MSSRTVAPFSTASIVACLLLWSRHAAAAPYEVSYGGRLTEVSGKPVAGPVNLRVTFFRSQAGNEQVTVAIPDFTNIPLQEGIFQLTLNLSPSDFHTVFNSTSSTYIQIEDLDRGVTYPRQEFSAVPYALKVPVSGTSITYNANGELALGNGTNILTLPAAAGTADKVLKSDGAGGLLWADDLTGGVGSITSADIQDGAITSSDIQDGSIANVDISGTAAIATSKLSGAVTSITGHGLGDAATKNVGTGGGDVAAGNHAHADATTTASGFMSAGDKVRLNAAIVTTDTGSVTSTMISNGTIVDTDVNASAGIATSKLSGAVTSITGHGLGSLATKSTVTTGDLDDGSVSLAKLSQTMCGADQILKMNGTGTALTCTSLATGSGSYAAHAADYTVTAADNEKLLNVTNQTTITLPAAATAGAGFRITVKRSGSALVRIMPSGVETIDGQNVGVMLITTNASVALTSSGTAWVIAGKDGVYGRASAFADLTCGGAGDSCYDHETAKAAGYAVTPGGKTLEYLGNTHGIPVWKELGGPRVLKPTGSDNWALMLNANGRGFSAVEFTAWSTIVGRVCPTNVYIDDSNKTTTGNCLYYTSEATQQLDSSGSNGTTGMTAWVSPAKWYVGNVKACSDKGMRLPTIYETTVTVTADAYYPTNDGSVTFAQGTGVPSQYIGMTWTASSCRNTYNPYCLERKLLFLARLRRSPWASLRAAVNWWPTRLFSSSVPSRKGNRA